MTFLRNLFAKKKVHSPSKDILGKIRARMKSGDAQLFEALFYCVVGPADELACFVRFTPFPSNSIGYVSDFNYDNDAARFELAAFLIARANAYLLASHSGFHSEISAILVSEFVETFACALLLPKRKVRSLLNDRLQKYEQLFSSEIPANKVLSLVSSTIHQAITHGGVPQSQMQSVPPKTITVDDLMIVKSLVNMETAFTPQMRSSIDRAVCLARR